MLTTKQSYALLYKDKVQNTKYAIIALATLGGGSFIVLLIVGSLNAGDYVYGSPMLYQALFLLPVLAVINLILVIYYLYFYMRLAALSPRSKSSKMTLRDISMRGLAVIWPALLFFLWIEWRF